MSKNGYLRLYKYIYRVTFKGGKGEFPPFENSALLSNFTRMAREGRGNFPLSNLFLSPLSINSLFRFYSHRYSDPSHQSALLALRYYHLVWGVAPPKRDLEYQADLSAGKVRLHNQRAGREYARAIPYFHRLPGKNAPLPSRQGPKTQVLFI